MSRCRHFKADAPTFASDGKVEASVDFEYPRDEADDDDDEQRSRRQTLMRLLQFLATDASAKKTGQRVLLLSHLLGVSGCRTQRALARRMGLTPGRVSQALNICRREMAMITGD